MNFTEYEEKYWSNGIMIIAGIDEAGRGPLAGPVVAASVVFKEGILIDGINDSKKLSKKKREFLYPLIFNKADSVGIGVVHEDKIDEINILQATFLAMRKSIGNLSTKPEQILIDGPYTDIKQISNECIVNGDGKSHSIAAASIIAKVFRDRMMNYYHLIFPEYDFINNKGYGTKKHINIINQLKATPIHRKSFNIVNSNLPNYKYINENYGFKALAGQISGCVHIKNNFILISSKFSNDNCPVDLILKKNKKIFFVLVFLKFEINSIDQIDKKYYLKKINVYLNEKDIRNEFSFNVNFVEFVKNNKPIITTIEIK